SGQIRLPRWKASCPTRDRAPELGGRVFRSLTSATVLDPTSLSRMRVFSYWRDPRPRNGWNYWNGRNHWKFPRESYLYYYTNFTETADDTVSMPFRPRWITRSNG